jgi:hypothetical protein
VKLNREHSLIKRLSEDTQQTLSKFYKEERNCDALTELLSKALVETHISPDDPNWLIKRARLDGQEAMLKTLISTMKEN